MLAYAANAPRTAERRSSPNALLAIIAGHVALVAVVMSARMDLPAQILDGPIKIIRLHPIDPPPPPHPVRQAHPLPGPTVADPPVPLPPSPGPIAPPGPRSVDLGQATGPVALPRPDPIPLPRTPVQSAHSCSPHRPISARPIPRPSCSPRRKPPSSSG